MTIRMNILNPGGKKDGAPPADGKNRLQRVLSIFKSRAEGPSKRLAGEPFEKMGALDTDEPAPMEEGRAYRVVSNAGEPFETMGTYRADAIRDDSDFLGEPRFTEPIARDAGPADGETAAIESGPQKAPWYKRAGKAAMVPVKNVTVNGAKASAVAWAQFGMGAQLLWSSSQLMHDTVMRQPVDKIIQNLRNSVFLQDFGYSMFRYTPESSGNGAWAIGTIGIPYFLNGIINSARAEVGNKAKDPNAPTKIEKAKAYGNAVADRIPSLAITGYMANLLAKTDIYSLGAKVFGNSNSTEAKAASAALADSLNYTLLGVPVFGVALAIYIGYVGMGMLGVFSKSK